MRPLAGFFVLALLAPGGYVCRSFRRGVSQMSRIFVNYRRADDNFAAELLDRQLCERYGSDEVFRASRSIRPGVRYRDAIHQALQSAEVLLAIIGPDWAARTPSGGRRLDDPEDYVRLEIR